MKNIAVISNLTRDINLVNTKKIVEKLREFDCNIFTDIDNIPGTSYIESKDALFKKAELVLSLGGDGTLLSVAQYSARYDVPVLGLNLGRLGFLVELEKYETDDIKKIFSGDYTTEERMMLDASVIRNGKKIFNAIALNDIVVSKGNVSKMIELSLKVDKNHAESYFADGLIVATPTGSTAYSLSAGGPVVEPNLKAMIITPICPHTITSRPLIISDSQTARISVNIHHTEDVILRYDGLEGIVLEHNDEIIVTKSKCKTKLIRFGKRSFFEILDAKLSERK